MRFARRLLARFSRIAFSASRRHSRAARSAWGLSRRGRRRSPESLVRNMLAISAAASTSSSSNEQGITVPRLCVTSSKQSDQGLSRMIALERLSACRSFSLAGYSGNLGVAGLVPRLLPGKRPLLAVPVVAIGILPVAVLLMLSRLIGSDLKEIRSRCLRLLPAWLGVGLRPDQPVGETV